MTLSSSAETCDQRPKQNSVTKKEFGKGRRPLALWPKNGPTLPENCDHEHLPAKHRRQRQAEGLQPGLGSKKEPLQVQFIQHIY